MIKKIHQTKIKKKNHILIWGNGKAKIDIIYVDDLAEACVYFMNKKTRHSLINIGTGKDFSINQITKKMLKIIIPNKKIKILYDKSKPNGTPRKVLDVSIAKNYGWTSRYQFDDAILNTYKKFLIQRNKK